MEIGSLRIDIDSDVAGLVYPDPDQIQKKLIQQDDVATQAAKAQTPDLQLFRSKSRIDVGAPARTASDLAAGLDNGDLSLLPTEGA